METIASKRFKTRSLAFKATAGLTAANIGFIALSLDMRLYGGETRNTNTK